jgi:GTP-binding protein EngB required for normal cell division
MRHYGAHQLSSKKLGSFEGSSKVFDGTKAVSSFVSDAVQGGVPLRVLLIVDPIDFSRGMWQQAVLSFQALENITLDVCVTKMDLLPPAADAEKMMASIVETVGTDSSNSIFAVSSTTQNGVKQVVQHLHQVLSSGISVLMVGFANAGKSSLANVFAGKLRRMVLDPDVAPASVEAADEQPALPLWIDFTVSKLPGTTIDVVSAPLLSYPGSEGAAAAQLYDSPGLISGLTYATLGARLFKNNLLANRICMSTKRKLQSLCVRKGQFLVIGRLFAIKVWFSFRCLCACEVHFHATRADRVQCRGSFSAACISSTGTRVAVTRC